VRCIAAAALAGLRRIDDHPFAREMLGERLAFATRARKPTYSRRPGDGPFRRKLVFSRGGLELFERQRQLLN
jgi:hypothetical protein